jgi:predicted GNAT family acetyltransferase
MIRLAAADDLEQICRFENLTQSEESRRKYLRTATESGECWVVENAEIVIAYAIMNYSFFGRGFVQIAYVHPSHRRKGLASQLLGELESLCESDRISHRQTSPMSPCRLCSPAVATFGAAS